MDNTSKQMNSISTHTDIVGTKIDFEESTIDNGNNRLDLFNIFLDDSRRGHDFFGG